MNIEIIGNGNLLSNNFSTSFLVNNILFCAPAGVLKELKRLNKNMDDISLIVITHLHGEEYFDLPAIILHECLRGRTKPLVIIGPKDLKRKVTKLLRIMLNKTIVDKYFHTFDLTFTNAEVVQNANLIDDYRFSFINVKHGKLKNCYGLIIKNDSISLGYTGGAEICPGLTYLLKSVKTCIIDIPGEQKITLEEFKNLADDFDNTFLPVGYPDGMEVKLAEIKNVKIVKPQEQFYI